MNDNIVKHTNFRVSYISSSTALRDYCQILLDSMDRKYNAFRMYALTLLVCYTIDYTATISVIIAFNGIWVAWILYDARCVLRDNVAREV